MLRKKSSEYEIIFRSHHGKHVQELNSHIKKAGNSFNAVKKKFLSKKERSEKTNLTPYKSIYTPKLTYRGESLVLTSRKESSIQETEMRCLKKLGENKIRVKISISFQTKYEMPN